MGLSKKFGVFSRAVSNSRSQQVDWQVRAIRGATTAEANTALAMRDAVAELLDVLESHNQLTPDQLISVTFTVTRDLDALFPAAVARERPAWQEVALLDVQQMHVENSLSRCIRVLAHAYLPLDHAICHPYLRGARQLRPDRADLISAVS